MLTEIVEGDIIATVVNLAMVCGRGRLQESIKFSSLNSTQRDPSVFKYVNTDGAGSLTAAGRKRNAVSKRRKVIRKRYIFDFNKWSEGGFEPPSGKTSSFWYGKPNFETFYFKRGYNSIN